MQFYTGGVCSAAAAARIIAVSVSGKPDYNNYSYNNPDSVSVGKHASAVVITAWITAICHFYVPLSMIHQQPQPSSGAQHELSLFMKSNITRIMNQSIVLLSFVQQPLLPKRLNIYFYLLIIIICSTGRYRSDRSIRIITGIQVWRKVFRHLNQIHHYQT